MSTVRRTLERLASGAILLALLLPGWACSDKTKYHPPAEPEEITPLSYLREMDGDEPAHAGETVTVQGVATMGTGVMVSGRYLKFHIQDETGGAYVFADTEATPETRGYDGSTFVGIEIYPGDLVRIRGTIGSHSGMIEFYPLSGNDIQVLGHGEIVPAPHVFSGVDALYATGVDYVGALVRVNDLALQGEDPASAWPAYGQKAKEIAMKGAGDLHTLYMDIYPGSGIPGSTAPAGRFDLVGVLHRKTGDGGEATYTVYPRALYDIDPADDSPLSGYTLSVYEEGHEDQAVTVSVDQLPQCLYDTGREGGPGEEPVVTLASLILPRIVPDPKNWSYLIVARDGRRPFDTLDFNQLKSGLLYEDLYEGASVLNSFFYPGMGLSHIYFLNDVAEVVLYPAGGGPEPGEATHGEGINLVINGTTYAVDFADLPDPGQNPRALADFVPDNIMDLYTMNDSFSYDQIRVLYDYRLVPFGGGDACFPVTWDQIDPSGTDPLMVEFVDGLPRVTGLEGCGPVDDLFTIEMVRKVVLVAGTEEMTLYWKDLPTTPLDVGGGVEEDVVFLDDVLDAAGLTEEEKLANDYYLLASDDFGTYFPYGHHHLEEMYFRPLANQTFVSAANPEMPAYGGRFSVKALLKIELRPIPRSDPPSLYVDSGPGTGWLSDPENGSSCSGCHVKHGEVRIPVNCAECHP